MIDRNKKVAIFLLALVLAIGVFQLVQGVTKSLNQTADIAVNCSDPDGNLSQCNVTSPCSKICPASGYSGSCSCQFTCTAVGTYNACGQSRDSGGLVDNKCLDTVVCVNNQPPGAPGFPPPPGPPFPAFPVPPSSAETWDNCTIQEKSQVTLNWIYSDPDNDPQDSYQVLVDNNANFSSPGVNSCVENTTCNPGNSSESYVPIANLNFNTAYYWRVKVKDNQGNWSNWSNSRSFNTPNHAYPWIDFSWAPVSPKAKELIQFTDQTTYYGGSAGQSWSWNFGDSQTASIQNPTHSYSASGNYQVQLGTTDTSGYYCDGANRKKSLQISLPLPEWKEVSPF